MPYAATITVTPMGAGAFRVQIDEVDASSSSEAQIVLATYGLPTQGSVLLQQATLTSGTGVPGATIDPVLQTTTGATTGVNAVAENAVAARDIDNEALRPIPYYSAGGSLFHRATVSSPIADHVIQTVYQITRGW